MTPIPQSPRAHSATTRSEGRVPLPRKASDLNQGGHGRRVTCFGSEERPLHTHREIGDSLGRFLGGCRPPLERATDEPVRLQAELPAVGDSHPEEERSGEVFDLHSERLRFVERDGSFDLDAALSHSRAGFDEVGPVGHDGLGDGPSWDDGSCQCDEKDYTKAIH